MAKMDKKTNKVEYSAKELNQNASNAGLRRASGDVVGARNPFMGDVNMVPKKSRGLSAKIPAFNATVGAQEVAEHIAGKGDVYDPAAVTTASSAGIAIMDNPETAAAMQRGATIADLQEDYAAGHETPISGGDISRLSNYREGTSVTVPNKSKNANRQVDPRTF